MTKDYSETGAVRTVEEECIECTLTASWVTTQRQLMGAHTPPFWGPAYDSCQMLVSWS